MHLSTVQNAVFGTPTLHSLTAVLEFTPMTTNAAEVDEEEQMTIEKGGMGREDTASWYMRYRGEIVEKNQAIKRSFIGQCLGEYTAATSY